MTGRDFARRAPESTRTTAQRLTRVLAAGPMTRRDLQVVLFPHVAADTERAGWTSMAIHLARDEGWVRNHGMRICLTQWGREQLELAEPFMTTRGEPA